MLLFDTNLVSALRKRPVSQHDRRMMTWAHATSPQDTFISAISLLEIEQGILMVERRDEIQAAVMRRWFDRSVLAAFENRTLPVDAAVARRAASLHVPNPMPERDSLIAATALVHRMTVVTRDVKDFSRMGVSILNPWAA